MGDRDGLSCSSRMSRMSLDRLLSDTCSDRRTTTGEYRGSMPTSSDRSRSLWKPASSHIRPATKSKYAMLLAVEYVILQPIEELHSQPRHHHQRPSSHDWSVCRRRGLVGALRFTRHRPVEPAVDRLITRHAIERGSVSRHDVAGGLAWKRRNPSKRR